MSWGTHGNALTQDRYIEPITERKGRRKCDCGCRRMSTHRGMANGVCLAMGCELHMRRWVRNPSGAWAVRRRNSP